MKQQKPTFQAVFTPEPEGGFTVTVPAVPECVTYGATFEEASANAQEALLLCLEHRLASGEDISFDPERSAVIGSISVPTEELHA